MRRIIGRLRDDERGTTAIEYGLIIAGIAFAIMTVIYTVGDDIVGLFQEIMDLMPGGG